MGIKVSTKTKNPEALKLSNKIRSYLFEQEYGELKGKENIKNALKSALSELNSLVNEK